MVIQTETPLNLFGRPDKAALCDAFVGRPLDGLRTPAIIVDRKLFAENCANMHKKARDWGASFRAHLKTHKTAEGTKYQLHSTEDQTHAVVVSTLLEAWEVVRAGLVADSTVKDILYGLPVGVNKVEDLSALWKEMDKYGGVVRLMVDHPDQVKFLDEFESKEEKPRRWSAFVKINGGQNRAGILPTSPEFLQLVGAILKSSAVTLHGFYGHAGNAYGSTSLSEASGFLSGEVHSVNTAAKIALDLISQLGEREISVTQPFVLSVGSTPTAHAASAETRKLLSEALHGVLELHAGNYPMLDLQQQHTSLIDQAHISQKVRATVVSYYPGRGTDGVDEAIVDAGAIAFSKDTGPSGLFGEVIGHPWVLARMSQEHGILAAKEKGVTPLKLGDVVDIIGQHACLIAAAYPWYYIVDSNVDERKRVVDVWVPWKGW
ncbi:putative serine dehydratase domain-containing protein [Crepidotus variabilis]|uniref:D-serine dehydratase n=1 Tax=Crepidotus variabilis TaxID=179855 RepID=A0A9P6JWT5_9AGAR|nr:putative serine dehydratase domain-containing protein [Crepidotus variabilis]